MSSVPSASLLVQEAKRQGWCIAAVGIPITVGLTWLAYHGRASGSMPGWAIAAIIAGFITAALIGVVYYAVDEAELDWQPAEAEILDVEHVSEYRTRYGPRGPFANVRVHVLSQSVPFEMAHFAPRAYIVIGNEVHDSAVTAPAHPWPVNDQGHAVIPVEVALTRQSRELRVRLPFAHYMDDVPLENIPVEKRVIAKCPR